METFMTVFDALFYAAVPALGIMLFVPGVFVLWLIVKVLIATGIMVRNLIEKKRSS